MVGVELEYETAVLRVVLPVLQRRDVATADVVVGRRLRDFRSQDVEKELQIIVASEMSSTKCTSYMK